MKGCFRHVHIGDPATMDILHWNEHISMSIDLAQREFFLTGGNYSHQTL
jgi:hypothetical protein